MVKQEKTRFTVRIESSTVDFAEKVGINLGDLIRGALKINFSPESGDDKEQAVIDFSIMMLENKKKIIKAIKEKKVDKSALKWVSYQKNHNYCADLHEHIENAVCKDEGCKHSETCAILNK